MKKLLSTFVLGVQFVFMLAGQAVSIDPNMPPNPPSKAGYNLIMADEFNTFNSAFWDRSDPGNDLWNYGEPDFCEKYKHTPLNTSNVLALTPGILDLRVREGEDQNACDFSGAEIKSWNNHLWSDPSITFKNWLLYPETFVEARIKIPDCKGIGGAFWLYGGAPNRFFEVDVFELHDGSAIFQSNIHYGKTYEDASHQQHPRNHMGFSQSIFNPVILSEQFLTFGVEWTGQQINMYLNNVKYDTYYFSGYGSANFNPYLNPVPFNLRFGTGASSLSNNNPGDCGVLPQFFQLDYVRVFKKSATKAVSFFNSEISLCANFPWGAGEQVWVNYYPGATYTWEQTTSFNFQPYPPNEENNCACNRWWLSVVPGTAPGNYPLKLTVTFPGGYTEVLTTTVKVVSTNPPVPTIIKSFTNNNYDYYFGTPKDPNTLGYEYSLDGVTWIKVPNQVNEPYNIWGQAFSAYINLPRTVHVCVRAYNACGTSSMRCQDIVIPPTGHPGGLHGLLLPPARVLVDKIPGEQLFQLMVEKYAPAEAYEWSFDKDSWTEVSNTLSSSYNQFGKFEPGFPTFTIYVRAKNSLSRSEIYAQDITLPATSDMHLLAGPSTASLSAEMPAARSASAHQDDPEFYPGMIYNQLGQVVKTGPFLTGQIEELTGGLPAGVYFVVMKSTTSPETKVRKVVVNN